MTTQTPNLAALTQGVRPDVVSAIRQASATTGVDFAYLLEKAAAESSFDPQAQASTSSARGLYQFIDKTWLDTMDQHGAEHGYPNIASAITRDADGNPVVANDAAKEYILKIRENPRIAALMAAELSQDNKQTLEHSLERKVGNAELYMAHFLGAGAAAKFLGSMEANGQLAANHVVPAAARANAAVFYDQGKALTLDEVFARFEAKFSEAPEAAIIAASDPAFAALQAPAGAREGMAGGPGTPLRADLAMQLATLGLLQALNQPDSRRPHEWVV